MDVKNYLLLLYSSCTFNKISGVKGNKGGGEEFLNIQQIMREV